MTLARAALYVFILFNIPASYVNAAKIGDIVFNAKVSSMKESGVEVAVFPHAKHEEHYKCADCHPVIFKEKRGANDVSMQSIMSEKFCGYPDCHDGIKAFSLDQCKSCHIVK